MSIMTDGEIIEAIETGEIEISDFDRDRLQGCSYDCLLGDYFWIGSTGGLHLLNPVALTTGDFLLAHTQEFIRVSSSIQFTVHTTSTARRHGLDCCASAGWGDPGYCNRVTLELKADRGLVLPRRAVICQLAFYQLNHHVNRKYYGGYGSYPTIADAADAWKPEHMLPKPIKQGKIV